MKKNLIINYNLYIFGFQEPTTPIMEGVIDLHNHIFFYAVLILIVVCKIFFDRLYLKINIDFKFRNFISLSFFDKLKDFAEWKLFWFSEGLSHDEKICLVVNLLVLGSFIVIGIDSVFNNGKLVKKCHSLLNGNSSSLEQGSNGDNTFSLSSIRMPQECFAIKYENFQFYKTLNLDKIGYFFNQIKNNQLELMSEVDSHINNQRLDIFFLESSDRIFLTKNIIYFIQLDVIFSEKYVLYFLDILL